MIIMGFCQSGLIIGKIYCKMYVTIGFASSLNNFFEGIFFFFVKIEHFCLNLQIISPTFPPTNVLFEFSHNSGHPTNYHPIRYKTSFYLGLLQNGFNTQILYLQLHFLEPPKGQKYDNSEWTFYFQSFTFGVHEKHTD